LYAAFRIRYLEKKARTTARRSTNSVTNFMAIPASSGRLARKNNGHYFFRGLNACIASTWGDEHADLTPDAYGSRQGDQGRELRLHPNSGAAAALVPERLFSGIPVRVDDVTAGFLIALERQQAPRRRLFQEAVE
jgi:hypothetical protein